MKNYIFFILLISLIACDNASEETPAKSKLSLEEQFLNGTDPVRFPYSVTTPEALEVPSSFEPGVLVKVVIDPKKVEPPKMEKTNFILSNEKLFDNFNYNNTAEWKAIDKLARKVFSEYRGNIRYYHEPQIVSNIMLDKYLSKLPQTKEVQEATKYYLEVLTDYQNGELAVISGAIDRLEGFVDNDQLNDYISGTLKAREYDFANWSDDPKVERDLKAYRKLQNRISKNLDN
ncbi:hypothetical protein QQ020_20760 [Fulvivirgaceae bacterium BMA12]|uniref:Lipoprotein n=1 Tax=Agaribacillus aureus TaxID=3051825 RepID=A0ABT8L9U5_9BACT|nr:hypothetical protein [Fulvivirgaceae bacterium BMA12]